MPIISVIVPVYKSQNFVSKCLESIINQTFSDIEIICVNDKTPDNSFNIVKEYAKKDSRIVLIENEENKGAGLTRNAGIDIAKGEYISFVDSDDYIDSKFLEELYSTAKKYDVDIVSTLNIYHISNEELSYFDFIYSKNESVWKNKYKEYYQEGLVQTSSLSTHANLDIQYQFIAIWNKLWKKEFLDKNNIRFIDANGPEDTAFYYYSLAHEPKCAYNHRAIYYYVRINDMSLMSTRQSNKNILLDAIKVSNSVIHYYIKNNKQYINYIANKTLMVVFEMFIMYKNKEEVYYLVYNYLNEIKNKVKIKESYFLEDRKYIYKEYNLIKIFSTYEEYLFASDVLNQLEYIKANSCIMVENNKYGENWIKLFGIYNNKQYLKIIFFGINIVIKMDTEKINKIAWLIPVRKWRDNFRNKFK